MTDIRFMDGLLVVGIEWTNHLRPILQYSYPATQVGAAVSLWSSAATTGAMTSCRHRDRYESWKSRSCIGLGISAEFDHLASIFALALCLQGFPGMAIDDFESCRQTPISAMLFIPGDDSLPRIPSHQPGMPTGQDIMRTNGFEFDHQSLEIGIGKRDDFHIHDRVAEARIDEQISDIVHIQKRIDVRMLIECAERFAQFLQGVGAEGAEHQ